MGFSLKKIGKSLEKGVKSVAKNAESLVSKAGKTLESGVREVGKGVENIVRETGKGVDEGLHWVDDNKGAIAGTLAGVLTGGVGTALLAGMAGKTMVDDPAKASYEQRAAEAKANAISREAALMTKQSMLANELSMTARRAMSKRAQANLRKNTSTPASQFLGGEQQTLG